MNTCLVAVIAGLPLLLTACSKPASTTADPPESNSSSDHARIHLSDAQLRDAAIQLAVVGPATLRDTLPLYGTIVVNAERTRDVVARFPGLVKSVNHRVGDAVRQGETLAIVESNESLQTYSILSPLAGTIAARNANGGEQTSDKPLFVVVDLSTVWVELSLFAHDAGKVHKGQAVLVRLPGSDAFASGQVAYVGPFGTSTTQSLTARVLLDNPAMRWTPGLYVNGEVVLSERQVPVAVRRAAVQRIADQSVVFVRTANGIDPRRVQLGQSDSQFVEIVGGLKVGESYAASNSYVLKAEALKSQAESD